MVHCVQDSNNIGDAGCYCLRHRIKRNDKVYAKFCIYTVTHKMIPVNILYKCKRALNST